MKKVLLVCASLLIGLTTASATELNKKKRKITINKTTKHYYLEQPIVFNERGIEFFIFSDGSFDFNTNANNYYYNDAFYKKNSRRSSININHRGPNSNIQYTSNRYANTSVSISRDRNGKIRRIGNVFLNYDRHGRITRAGSVFMKYNRGKNSNLHKVGGLKVKFNKYGEIIYTRGHVNQLNNINLNDDYYYKHNKRAKKIKRHKKN
ncbi:hypothetical protein [Algibacter sp. PT7-4]|uniref:hypothetical protein n=1 Tax=Algibacter ulvanivorans TaxID=3400999 RepID=UPI003AAEC0D1